MRKFLLLIGFICLFTGTALAQELKTFSENGYFGLKDIEGKTLSNSAKWKDLTLLEKAKYYSIERISRS